jgi:hypothetical protein
LEDLRRPYGAGGGFGVPNLGLKAQALRHRPYGAALVVKTMW